MNRIVATLPTVSFRLPRARMLTFAKWSATLSIASGWLPWGANLGLRKLKSPPAARPTSPNLPNPATMLFPYIVGPDLRS
jgi:hypothetical protein